MYIGGYVKSNIVEIDDYFTDNFLVNLQLLILTFTHFFIFFFSNQFSTSGELYT